MASTGHGGSEVSKELWRPCGTVKWKSHWVGGLGSRKLAGSPGFCEACVYNSNLGLQEEFPAIRHFCKPILGEAMFLTQTVHVTLRMETHMVADTLNFQWV